MNKKESQLTFYWTIDFKNEKNVEEITFFLLL